MFAVNLTDPALADDSDLDWGERHVVHNALTSGGHAVDLTE